MRYNDNYAWKETTTSTYENYKYHDDYMWITVTYYPKEEVLKYLIEYK